MKNELDAVIITAELSSVGTAISTFALLFIFNQLINRSLADEKHEAAIQRQTEQVSDRISYELDESHDENQVEICSHSDQLTKSN